ncbi:hypothetical protein, partial [Streptomyces sp. CC53]|uniref:hypothetical protein n=1 Tax=Streptomyces sp. CC53 TaxID=1906740 RepID=UPI001C435154
MSCRHGRPDLVIVCVTACAPPWYIAPSSESGPSPGSGRHRMQLRRSVGATAIERWLRPVTYQNT